MVDQRACPEQKIYVGQTALSIQLDTEIDLTTMNTGLIKYVKPDGATGQWSAALVGNAADGVIGYDISSASDLDQDGLWEAWSYVTFNDGAIAPGDVVTFYVYDEGQ